MLPKPLAIARLVLREALARRATERTPEPTSEMDSEESVRSFDREGAASLVPIYHFNALAISALAPECCHVLDLGSGSGRFLTYLAACRPDLIITGIEFAPNMARLGNESLAAAGLNQRVR